MFVSLLLCICVCVCACVCVASFIGMWRMYWQKEVKNLIRTCRHKITCTVHNAPTHAISLLACSSWLHNADMARAHTDRKREIQRERERERKGGERGRERERE